MNRTGRTLLLFMLAAFVAAGCRTTQPTTEAPEEPAEPAPPRQARAPEHIEELPPVPEADGELNIQLAYPTAGAGQPNADSTFLFGTVGTGNAQLAINDIRIPVAPNGSFLAYVPVPEDGRYEMVAEANGDVDRTVFTYGQPVTADAATPLPEPRVGTVISGRDTLATGSEIASATPEPRGDRRWFFPEGARLTVTGELAELYRIRLGGRDAWIEKTVVELGDRAPAEPASMASPRLVSHSRYVDLQLPADFAPFQIDAQESSLGVTVYDRSAPTLSAISSDSFVTGADWSAEAGDSTRLDLQLGDPLWGYKAFYQEDGTLVIRLRRPPETSSASPLQGLRVMVDPGHPPGGAIGPTGLTEAEANLDISLRMADMLRERGAEVILTRTSAAALENATNTADELWARVTLAVDVDADILVSVHNNAFPDGTNPFENYGTETYYFNGFARPLAEHLVEELVSVTGLPNLGAKQRSLALTRPTWMPAVLTESLFMMFPQQEAALKDPGFLDRLAEAHVRGIEAFLRSRLGGTAEP